MDYGEFETQQQDKPNTAQERSGQTKQRSLNQKEKKDICTAKMTTITNSLDHAFQIKLSNAFEALDDTEA